MWIAAAAMSAVFGSLSSFLAKAGVRKMDPDLGTALRTTIVTAVAWLAALCTGAIPGIVSLTGRTWFFLFLTGLTNGLSWIFYYRALTDGPVNVVMPIEKSSIAAVIPLAAVLFGETFRMPLRLLCAGAILAGILLLIDRRGGSGNRDSRKWLLCAFASLFFSAVNTLVSKVGIDGVNSHLGTAINVTMILPLSWGVALWRGQVKGLPFVPARELWFTLFSGIATGFCWLCFYYGIKYGTVTAAIALNKLSIPLTGLLSVLFFHEKLRRRSGFGLGLITAGTLVLTLFT